MASFKIGRFTGFVDDEPYEPSGMLDRGPVILLPGDGSETRSGRAVISAAQRKVHIVSEIVAVVAVVPFMAYLALDKRQTDVVRGASGAIAIGTLIVDGGLLMRWLK